MSKGALSYQIARLEEDLEFKIFERVPSGLHLTAEGRQLWHVSQVSLSQIDNEIQILRGRPDPEIITVGVLTYFFSRWLSPLLMSFMEQNPGIGVRIEALNGESDLKRADVDVGILWGRKGDWPSYNCVEILRSSARPAANPKLAKRVQDIGIEAAVSQLPLLSYGSSVLGWERWHEKAQLPYAPGRDDLMICDSNARVQGVIDGQGLALCDELALREIEYGELQFVSDVILEDHSYWALKPPIKPKNKAIDAFIEWILTVQD